MHVELNLRNTVRVNLQALIFRIGNAAINTMLGAVVSVSRRLFRYQKNVATNIIEQSQGVYVLNSEAVVFM
jgi:hypothetical protein